LYARKTALPKVIGAFIRSYSEALPPAPHHACHKRIPPFQRRIQATHQVLENAAGMNWQFAEVYT